MSSNFNWICESCGLTNRSNVILCQACFGSSSNDHRNKVIADAKALLQKHNQSHVLAHINDIDSSTELNRLLLQIYSIDFEYINNLYKRAITEENALKDAESDAEHKKQSTIAPFPHKDAFNIDDIGDVNTLCNLGFKAIAESKCSVIILAGGQGSRLGFNRPKGCFNIGLPSNSSIYQILFEKALAVKRTACTVSGVSNINNVRFPIYLMTSEATHEDTKTYLRQNNFFNYPKQDIVLFKQSLFPCLNEANGAFIMESASNIAMNPNGNGGIYSSLKQSGVLQQMLHLNIEYVQIFGIDNILARIGDPLWFGHMIESGADASNKTCIKKDVDEKIGIMCLKNGKPAVTEYTELTKDMIELKQKDADDLEYCYGNLAMHQFNFAFIQNICNDEEGKYALPIHIARKKIAYYDAKQGKTVKPQSNNGIKLEFFVFDTFQFSKKCTVYNILREEEFAPVKNAQGKDSPYTARTAHSVYWKKEILKNGATFVNDSEDVLCEVSPLFGYLPYGENAAFKTSVNGKTFRLPFYFSRL